MGMARPVLCALSGVALLFGAASLASAQPSVTPPGAAPAPTTAQTPDRYPADLAQRPLLMPSGMFEGSAELQTSSWDGDGVSGADFGDYLVSKLNVRIGTGPVELFGNAEVQLITPDGNPSDTLVAIGGGARVQIAPNHALEAKLLRYMPYEDVGTLVLDLGYAGRVQAAPNVAAIFSGGINHLSSTGNTFSDYSVISLAGGFTALVQVDPQWGVRSSLRLIIPVHDSFDYDFEYPTQTSFDLQLVFTTRRADLFAGIGTQVSGDYGRNLVLSIGAAARLP